MRYATHGYCDQCNKLMAVEKDKLEEVKGADLFYLVVCCPECRSSLNPCLALCESIEALEATNGQE